MKLHKKKFLLSLLVCGLVVGLIGSNTLSADEIENLEEETIVEEQLEEIEVDEVVEPEEVEETVVSSETESVQQLSGIVATSAGVDALVPDTTTLGEAFPDDAFRKVVAETVLSKVAGTYDESTVLTSTDINKITARTTLTVSNTNCTSMEGIQHFVGLTTLNVTSNKIEGELKVSNLTGLRTLYCHNNQITTLNVTNLTNLTDLRCNNNKISTLDISNINGLVTLYAHENPYSELNVSAGSKTTLVNFTYRNTNVANIDLTGFTSLSILAITKSTGGNLSTVNNLQISGTRAYDDRYCIRLYYTANALTRDVATGYYIVAPNMGVEYKFHIPVGELIQGAIDTPQVALAEGGVIDDEGNLVIGATASNIASDGTITLPSGGTIATPEGTFTFTGSVSIKNGVITTGSTYTYEKNTATYDEGTGTATGNVGDVVTTVDPGNGTASISTIGSGSQLPEGSVVTNNDGDKTYLTGTGTIDSEGNITTGDTYITVDASEVGSIVDNGDGTITLPGNSTVTSGGESVTYPGEITFNEDNGTVLYLPIDELLNGNGNDLASNITQEDIADAQTVLDGMADSDLKTELQNKVDTAQDILNAKEAVDDLFNSDGSLKEGVTQEDLDNVEDLINKIPDGDLKEDLKDKLEEAQKELDEREAEKAVEDLFKPDGSGEIKDDLTQEDIDNAEDLVNKLPDGNKKDELKDKLEEAQNQLDEKEAEDAVEDLFKPDGSGEIRDDLSQEEIDNAQDLINKLPDGDKKNELQDKLNEAQKQLDEKLFVVIEHFAVFKGTGTVYTKIDAPVERFSKVYVDRKVLLSSNYVVTSGSTVITLNETYLKTLGNGDYKVEVEFDSGAKVSSTLTVDVRSNASKAPTTPTTSNPSINANNSSTSGSGVNSGDTTNNLLYFMMLVSSFAVLGFYTRRKREIK